MQEFMEAIPGKVYMLVGLLIEVLQPTRLHSVALGNIHIAPETIFWFGTQSY